MPFQVSHFHLYFGSQGPKEKTVENVLNVGGSTEKRPFEDLAVGSNQISKRVQNIILYINSGQPIICYINFEVNNKNSS